MADILSPTGIEKPLGPELHSREMVNRNYDRTNQIEIDSRKRANGYMQESKIRTSASAAVTTLSVIENIASFTFKAGRKYRITWDFSYTFSVATDYYTAKIQSCSTADSSSAITGLTELVSRSLHAGSAGAGQPGHVETIYLTGGSDTTLQIKFTTERALGTGTFTMEASKAFFTIEDLGAQF